MIITSLRISNILNFKYFENIEDAPEIKFNKGLNLLVGHNGSGKSTVAAVLKWIFGAYFFSHPSTDRESKKIVTTRQAQMVDSFRIQKNWNSHDKIREVKVEIILEGIDIENLKAIVDNYTTIEDKLNSVGNTAWLCPRKGYQALYEYYNAGEEKRVRIAIKEEGGASNVAKYTIENIESTHIESLKSYFEYLNYFQQALCYDEQAQNYEQKNKLRKSCRVLSAFRDYAEGSTSININKGDSEIIIESEKHNQSVNNFSDINSGSQVVQSWVRDVAVRHNRVCFNLGKKEADKSVDELVKILKQKLKSIGLDVFVRRVDETTLSYSAQFTKQGNDGAIKISALSAGERAYLLLMISLLGDDEGGLLVIDEPEIHLHHQLQEAFQKCLLEVGDKKQVIIISHSDVFLNEKTIKNTIRFQSKKSGGVGVYQNDEISADDEQDVRFLRYKRAGYLFFCKKVILVEGESDRLFFQAIIDTHYSDSNQEVGLLDIGGNGDVEKWQNFLGKLGIETYAIVDWDTWTNLPQIREKDEELKNIYKNISAHEPLTCAKRGLTKMKEGSFDLDSLWNKLRVIIEKRPVPPSDEEYSELEGLFYYLDSKFKCIPDWKFKFIENNSGVQKNLHSTFARISKKEKLYILKKGAIEVYTHNKGKDKKFKKMLEYCTPKNIDVYFESKETTRVEIKEILDEIIHGTSCLPKAESGYVCEG